ncbi:MAG: hypothetical protein RML72_09410 [Bacteroidia bacterium]|nr:hypothetical protein [Bacteroidia bacterium]MDW8159075.1 hypothetical protein [Bacteroidia bacterium]
MKLLNILVGSKSGITKEEENDSDATLQDFRASLNQNNYKCQFHAAAQLMEKKEYFACIKAYQTLIGMYPDKRDYCELQIADAYKWLGDTKKAIEFLVAARIHGADAEKVDDSMWALCEDVYYQSHNSSKGIEAIEKYIMFFPKGKHISEAKALLIS